MNKRSSKWKTLLVKLMACIPIEYLFQCFEYIRIQRLKRRIHSIGKRCMITSNFFVMSPEKLVVEDNVSFGRGVRIMGAGDVVIKKDTMIANGVTILTTTHDARAKRMKETAMHKNVTIGEGVWIGANATILPGVNIHNNSIVGAGAVIVHDIKEGDVVVPPHARVVRNRNDNI